MSLDLKKRKCEKVKARLLNACSTYNYQTAWKQARKKGSTKWIFEKNEYKAWQSEQNHSSALWCTGILGSGKTVLCASIVDDIILAYPTAVVGYFFCRYDEAESLKARTILGSIARQLLVGVKLDLSDTPNLADLEFLDRSQILDLADKLLPSDQQYFVLVDGVDECDEEESVFLLQDLKRLLPYKRSLHLYCSSRPDTLQRVLVHFQPLHKLSMPDGNHEIAEYIEAELETRLESERLCLGESGIILIIRDALVKGAQGM